MTGEVVIDEWTIVVFGDAAMSATDADRLRELVDTELAATTDRLTRTLAPGTSIRLMPR